MVTMAFDAQPVPLRTEQDGTIRVGKTRVTLDVLVSAFDAGASAETIASDYPSLDLGDVYSALAYVINHRGEVDEYIQTRRRESALLQTECEKRWPTQALREKLLARQRGGR